MGRYYNTDSGKSGKFMFGVQPSDDPQLLGMHELEPCTITYYASHSDYNEIKNKLDEQYDLLGVLKKDRRYAFKRDESIEKYLTDIIYPKVFKTIRRDSYEAQDAKDRWTSDKGDKYVDIPMKKSFTLCYGRIRLAIIILSDIKWHGYCELEADT